MSHRVELTTAAARQLRKLPRPARDRLLTAIENLSAEPRPRGATKLIGEDTAWRLRVGDYRVIYDVLDDVLTVLIVRVAHRREVYDR